MVGIWDRSGAYRRQEIGRDRLEWLVATGFAPQSHSNSILCAVVENFMKQTYGSEIENSNHANCAP
jgi:hypothetical protein